MGLNKSSGNMYPWITDTWNTVKGACYHDCSYCYMKRWGKLNPVRFDEKELKTDLGKGNFIFVGSSCDMFAKDIPDEWITKTIDHCECFASRYLFQTKNPKRITFDLLPGGSAICTTIETNRVYPEIMNNSPEPIERAWEFATIPIEKKYITIEPIMDFDLKELVHLVAVCNPEQVNIGADSGKNNLPEPGKTKIQELIEALSEFTVVKQKKNLKRLL